MKRILFTFCGILIVSGLAFGQAITLTGANAADLNHLIGKDAVARIIVDSSSLPSFAAGTNATWDLSHVVYDTNVYNRVRFLARNPYKFADSIGYQYGTARYYTQGYSLYATNGIQQWGEDIDSQTAAPTFLIGAYDIKGQLDFQTAAYTAPYYKLPFPATFHSGWNSNFKYTTNMTAYDTARKLYHTAGQIRTQIIEMDTIIGYGKMKVKRLDSKISAPINVLQLLTMKIKRDSLIITFNADTVASYMNSLGIVQGQTDTTYSISYYRIGELIPLANIIFTDGSYTTVKSVDVATDRIPLFPESVNTVYTQGNITIYPNPLTGHTLSVDMPGAATGQWSYQLINITGQTVATDRLSIDNNNTHAQIALSPSLVPGIYYIRFNNNGQQAAVLPLQIN